MALQRFMNVGLTSYEHIRTRYHAPLTVSELKVYLQQIPKTEYFRQHLSRQVLFGLTFGAVDLGARLATFRFMTEGINEYQTGFNIQSWRKPIPIIFGALFSCWVKAPFEIVEKAYYAD